MKVTIGIDGSHAEVDNCFDSLERLGFKDLDHVDSVYVIEHLGKADSLLGISAFLDNVSGSPFGTLQKKWADEAQFYASESATRAQLPFTPHIFSGQIANRLLTFVRDSNASLLVLGSSNKGPLESVIVGSVTRKCIIHSPVSVLVSKKPFPSRPLKAVLATDHSEYANRCIKLLAEFAPGGLREIVVASIYPAQQIQEKMKETKNFKLDVEQAIELQLENLNQGVIKSLEHLDCRFTSRVEADLVEEGLKRIMIEEQADLLIMGAQGHGFSDRLLMGSVSLHMAMNDNHSLLILRDASPRP